MAQEWNWQIDELKRQQEADASKIEEAIRSQTDAIRNASRSSSTSSGTDFNITDYIPAEKLRKWGIRIFLGMGIAGILLEVVVNLFARLFL